MHIPTREGELPEDQACLFIVVTFEIHHHELLYHEILPRIVVVVVFPYEQVIHSSTGAILLT